MARAGRQATGRMRRPWWLRDNAACRQDILDALRGDGLLIHRARACSDTTVSPVAVELLEPDRTSR